MANPDRPMGFIFAKTLSGTPATAMIRKYESADRSADTTGNHGDIYIGDPVALSAGKVVVANTGDTVVGVAVGTGTSGDIDHGDGGYYNSGSWETRYLAYDKDGYVAVVPAEGNLFEVQTSADLDLAVGALADMNTAAATAHGDRTTGRSTVELAAALNNDVKVVEHVDTPDNDVSLTNARHLVMFTTTANAQ